MHEKETILYGVSYILPTSNTLAKIIFGKGTEIGPGKQLNTLLHRLYWDV